MALPNGRTVERNSQEPKETFLHRLRPENERDLARYTGFALYVVTTAVIIGASFIPDLAPANVNYWRIFLGGPALAIGFAVLLISPKLSDRNFYRFIVVMVVPGFLVQGLLLQITPATLAVLTNLLVAVLFAGYFIKRRELIPMMILCTAIALTPLFTDIPGDTPHLAAWLTVYIPTMWALAFALHLQKTTIRKALGEVKLKAVTDPLTGLS